MLIVSFDDRPVLVIGATGTTGRRVVAAVRERGVPVCAASRNPGHAATGVTPLRFEWDDEATHAPALSGSRAVYLVPPPGAATPEAVVLPLLQRALELGVERVVLLSAAALEAGGPAAGQIHAALPELGMDWAVLRPSWFMQNLWNPEHHVGAAVLADREFVTATGQGRVAFVDAADIAVVAAHALLDQPAPKTDLVLTGPDALSYDDAAKVLTRATGRPVRHRASSADEAIKYMVAAGLPRELAEMLAAMETAIAAGAEDRVTDTVERITGRRPRDLATAVVTDDPFPPEPT